MFHRIMVPIDLSNRNIPALDIATQIAVLNRARITLLHVVETLEGSSTDDFNDFYEKLEKLARDKLRSVAEGITEKGVPVHEEIVFGKRAEEIVKYAMEHQIDLIILASHKIDLQNPAQGWGSISYKVGILSQCPVMLVK